MADGETVQVLIGRENTDHVKIEFATRGGTHSSRESNVTIKVGPWSGSFVWFEFGSELIGLANGLDGLYKTLRGRVEFEPLEPNLILNFEGNGRGQILIDGAAEAHLGSGTRLIFSLQLDQTDLPEIVHSLRRASFTSL